MNEIIQKLQALITSARASMNQTLSSLPPIDQYEAASEMAYILRNMKSSGDYLMETFKSFEGDITSLQAKVSEYVTGQVTSGVETALQARLASGEIVKKEDAEANLQAALQARENNIRAEIQKISTRRSELSTGEGAIPVEVAAIISDENLLSEDYKIRASKAAARVKELSDLGVSVPRVLCEAANLPTDDTGEATFNERLATFRGVAAKHGSAPGSIAGSGQSQSKDEKDGPMIAI